MDDYNYSRLLGRMRECGYSQKELAKAVNISEATLNLKLRNKSQFRQSEIVQISAMLSIPPNEYELYFFAH